MRKQWMWIAVSVVLLSPSAARAEWLFTPSIGGVFGGDTFGANNTLMSFAIASLDEDAFGWEGNVSMAPNFFDDTLSEFDYVGDGNVTTAMINALIGLPVAGRPRTSLRPYVTGGVGLMRMHVVSDPASPFVDTEREFGWNLGAGMMTFFRQHLGLRGDLRYVRSFRNGLPSWTRNVDVDVAPGHFDFFQATIGLTFRIPD
jgi:opacity protein-like surface antigen